MKLKFFLKISILVSIGLSSAFALNEDVVYEQVVEQIESKKQCVDEQNDSSDFWKLRKVKGVFNALAGDNSPYWVRYSKFGCTLGKKGSLVVAPGRSESSAEYYETALDYINLGYSPVYVIDHRGQGFSPRLLENKHKGHVHYFEEFIDDFELIVEEVIAEVQAQAQDLGKKKQKMFLTTNSMGGGLAVAYLERVGEKNPFEKVVILGSMIKVNYASFVKGKALKTALILFGEPFGYLRANFNCLIGKCEDFATETFAEFDRNSRVFKENEISMMTHSKNRYELRNYLWDKDWKAYFGPEAYGENENWESLVLGGATNQFSRSTLAINLRMRRAKNIRKMSDVPLMIMTGEKDFRAYRENFDGTTDLSPHSDFCKKINRVRGTNQCQFVEIKKSFHEIYKESDIYRDFAFKTIDAFFMDKDTGDKSQGLN